MPNRPRGTRDFAPDEMAARTWAAARIRDTFRRFGFAEIQTPTFEELELFTAKSGDGIISELYDFQDKGERKLTLRPELTAPVMRMYHADHAFDPKPIKWFYHGSCFRYDRPQTGRYREFWQFGCEQIGAGTPLAYAELVALADACFDAVDLEKRELSVGHVAILNRLVDALGLGAEARGQCMRLIDKKDMRGLEAHLASSDPDAVQRLIQVMQVDSLDAARQHIDDEGLEELDAFFHHLDAFGVHARLDLGIARGLDYYTGIVFEVHCPSLEAQSQLLGGGGYDLSGIFGGQSTPTMGFGLGFDRTLVALEKEGKTLPVTKGPFLYLGGLGAGVDKAAEIAAKLRRDGIAIELDLLGRKPGQIAKAADACKAHHLVILGERDLESGQCQIKDLRSGDSHTVPVEDLRHWALGESGGVDMRDFN